MICLDGLTVRLGFVVCNMKYIVLVAVLVCGYLALANALYIIEAQIQRSHIDGNIPPTDVFDSYLQRDLLEYFTQNRSQEITLVDFTSLRDGPTQSGISFPKYYLWVKLHVGETVQEEGAVRIAAVQRTHFVITEYLSKTNIQSDPDAVGKEFPAALVPAIYELAGVARQ